ncbi:hypothetical protein G4B88_005447 [Cannabis sativa]|uniref:Uncharacterized protein n=1 Tax=Cannabis sativa TaxID=3483 RepID=A0A7J6HCW9_CANSA|nr:hypothetical protein G4B88_005447 [Cannabis sativa]
MEAIGVSSSSRSTSVRHRPASPINDDHRLQVLSFVTWCDCFLFAAAHCAEESTTTETPPLADDGGAGSPLLADDDAATSSSAPLSQTATMQRFFFIS